jgi:hypothetical protein
MAKLWVASAARGKILIGPIKYYTNLLRGSVHLNTFATQTTGVCGFRTSENYHTLFRLIVSLATPAVESKLLIAPVNKPYMNKYMHRDNK